MLNDRDEMEVYQTLTNLGQKPAGFRCDLLVPDGNGNRPKSSSKPPAGAN